MEERLYAARVLGSRMVSKGYDDSRTTYIGCKVKSELAVAGPTLKERQDATDMPTIEDRERFGLARGAVEQLVIGSVLELVHSAFNEWGRQL